MTDEPMAFAHSVEPMGYQDDARKPAVWRCAICRRRIRHYQYFRQMRDEHGKTLGSTELAVAWRHEPAK